MKEYYDGRVHSGKSVQPVLLILAGVLVLALIAAAAWSVGRASSSRGIGVSPEQLLTGDGNRTVFTDIYEANCDAIVVITEYVQYNGAETPYATGSGFIISKDGVILTNNHVVADASRVSVMLYNGHVYDAEVVGTDERTEVAVLKIKTTETLKTVKLGNSDKLEIGEYAIAIGAPMGYEYSLSVGFVSGVERRVYANNYAYKMIQVDTPLNSGNSGGPLFNIRGEVIGINTMKENATATSASVEGMGFAVPINKAYDVADQLLKTGKVSRAALQATVGNYVQNNAYAGVEIVELVQGGAAEQAGLKVNDVIVAFNDAKISMMNDLMEQLDNCRIGDTVKLTVQRGGETMTVKVTLGST